MDLLENESSELADRLIQGQVNKAEVEEHTFAIKRELAAIKQHDIDTNVKLEEAKDRICKLSEMVENSNGNSGNHSDTLEEEMSLKSEIIKQKEDMIQCLQDELIKVRLREAEKRGKYQKFIRKKFKKRRRYFINFFYSRVPKIDFSFLI